MTDDLVKRLREWDHCWPARWLEGAVAEAADRIAALEVALAELIEVADNAAWAANIGIMDEAIRKARAALEAKK